VTDYIIDPEFQELLPPQDPRERSQLEANMVSCGECTVPLTIWPQKGGKAILVDGMNRLEVIQEHDLRMPKPIKINFETREEVKEWIVNNQLGRRNLNEMGKALLRSALVELKVGRGKLVSKAVEEVAEAEGVSVSTVNKDRKAAKDAPKSGPTPSSKKSASNGKVTSEKKAAKKAKKADPISSAVKLQKLDEEIHKAIGNMLRMIDSRYQIVEGKKCWRECLDHTRKLSASYEEWKKLT